MSNDNDNLDEVMRLREENAKLRQLTPRAPDLTSDRHGLPRCTGAQCPKFIVYTGICSEVDREVSRVCEPQVMDMAIELDARRDAADGAFNDIVQLCGLAKTWEYPGQVVRDVQDALKRRDERIEELVVQIHTAETVRDEARAASQRDLEARRLAQSERQLAEDTASAALALLEAERRDRADCNGAHVFVDDCCRDCGLHAPRRVAAPRTEAARPTARSMGDWDPLHNTCQCSPKYVELAPGVHAKYCPLAGLPLERGPFKGEF